MEDEGGVGNAVSGGAVAGRRVVRRRCRRSRSGPETVRVELVVCGCRA